MATVLVVDDDRLSRQLIARTLSDAGSVVIEACDGFQAINLISLCRRQLTGAVIDTAMPGLHGWEVIRFARGKQPNIPVLRLGHAEDVVPGREYQAFHELPVLLKPFTRKELLAALRSRLRLRINGRAKLGKE